MEKQLSIIVPVYNSSAYLEECLTSLTLQGFQKDKHEVLIIDDGSTDNSVEIINSFCAKFDYFRLVRKINGGVSSARNLGIDLATGKFIAFVDSDDIVACDTYLHIVGFLEKNNYKSFYFGYTRCRDKLDIFDPNLTYSVLRENSCKPSSCRYIYTLEVIKKENLLFDETLRHNEDYLFNYTYVQKVGNISAATAQRLYYYRPNPGSATGKAKTNRDSQLIIRGNLISFAKKIKDINIESALKHDILFEKTLSGIISDYLWLGMIMKEPPKRSLESLFSSGLSNKDIKYRVVESSKLRSFIEYYFRFSFIYSFVCLLYRVIKR